MHHSPSLRSLLALAMVSAAGATIAQTPKLAEGIATGIKRVLDVLAPEHEAQGQPSVTGCLGPIPTVVVGPGGSVAGVAASILTHKDESKSALDVAAEKFAHACATVDALDAQVSSAHDALQKAEQNLLDAQDAKKEAATALYRVAAGGQK